MGVQRLDDLIAFQEAVAFKREIYQLLQAHPAMSRDRRYRDQLVSAAASVEANIAEGWGRMKRAQMCVFLGFAIGSLDEARHRLLDAVDRGYLTTGECQKALEHARRCGGATVNLRRSLEALSEPR